MSTISENGALAAPPEFGAQQPGPDVPAVPPSDSGGGGGGDGDGDRNDGEGRGRYFSWRNMAGLFLVPAGIVGVIVAVMAGVLFLAQEPRKIEDYAKMLESDQIKERWVAAQEIARLGIHHETLLDPMIEVLAQPDAITTGNRIPNIEWRVTNLLRSGPEEQKLNLRWYAAAFIGQFPHEDRALEALRVAAGDDDPGVRFHAVGGLFTMVMSLAQNVKALEAKGRSETLSAAAETELKRMRDRLAVIRPVALDVIASHADDEDDGVRKYVAYALQAFPGSRARTALRGLLGDPNENVRLNATLSLGMLGDASVRPQVEAMTRHEDFAVRAEAQRVLTKMKSTSER